MKQQVLLTIFFCCINILSFGQGKVNFTAQTNAQKVVKGGFFQIVFQVKNGTLDNFKPPKFKNFQVVSGPMQSSEISIVNGKRSQAAKITYGLSASKVGKFKIGSASIKVNGKTYKTAPLTIEIVKGNNKQSSSEKQFVTFELDLSEAYIGQQIIGALKVYSKDRILNAELLSLPEITNAYHEPINDQNLIRSGTDVINGEQYNTYVLQKYAIFPQKVGELTIEPTNVYLETLSSQSGFMRQLRFNLATETVSATIKKLENRPANFSEGVGKYNFSVVLNKEKLSTDETLTLILNIIGTGDIKLIQPTNLDSLKADFEIYEPTIETQNAVQNGRMISQKLITYVLAPKKTGRFQFSKSFTYFDTEVENYITLQSDTFEIQVTQGMETEEATEDFSKQDIYPIITKENTFLNLKFFGTTLFWALLILPFLALVIVLIRKKQVSNKSLSESASKISKADKVALARLEQAKVYLEAKNEGLFYNEINQSLFTYISDKFSIPFSELSKNNIRLRLEQQKVTSTKIDKFIQILNTCELALFAGIQKSENMQSTYDNAKQVIVEIEK